MVGSTDTNASKASLHSTKKKISVRIWSHQPYSFQMDIGDHFAGLYLCDWCIENPVRTILVKQTLGYLQRTPAA
jgi:hypothetical protein